MGAAEICHGIKKSEIDAPDGGGFSASEDDLDEFENVDDKNDDERKGLHLNWIWRKTQTDIRCECRSETEYG